ncbi:hypothetical protein ACP70R_011158 [Stipagrostis hirtigluma subsp. patula]
MDNCQTLTHQEPLLKLTGPVRAVMLCGAVDFEVSLYVRGTTESEDKELSLLAVSFRDHGFPSTSSYFSRSYTSRLSKLDFLLGHIVSSAEATIRIKVISAPPDGFRGVFEASTDTPGHVPVLLLDNSLGKAHLAGDEINLSRRVVSVEFSGLLTISVAAGHDNIHARMGFKPREKGTTTMELKLDWSSCKLEVIVAWSLFSYL